MRDERVTLLATSGTTADRLQVIWEWSWWDPQEREAMRLNAAHRRSRWLASEYREAVLTTPACGARHVPFRQPDRRGAQHRRHPVLQRERRPDALDGPANASECCASGTSSRRCGVEADPAYLAIIARAALQRGVRLPSPEFITLTYETTTRAMRRDIARAFDAPLFQLYGATEAGVLFMECEHGRLHPNERHSHIDLEPLPGTAGSRACS